MPFHNLFFLEFLNNKFIKEQGKYKRNLATVVLVVEIYKKVTCSQCKQNIGGHYVISGSTVMQ